MLGAPVLTSPVNDSTITDVASFLRWAPVWINEKDKVRCKVYDLQISRNEAFTDLFLDKRRLDQKYHENNWFPKDLLPEGKFFWRVRAVTVKGLDEKKPPRDIMTLEVDETSEWSEAWKFSVTRDHTPQRKSTQHISLQVTPEKPMFGLRNRHWNPAAQSQHLREIIPDGLQDIIISDDQNMWDNKNNIVIEKAKGYETLGVNYTLWLNRAQNPLSLIEYLFQHFEKCVGVAEGESLDAWFWEKGPEGNKSEQDYILRLWKLCEKYGKLYIFADGEAAYYRYTQFMDEVLPKMTEYEKKLFIPGFKSTKRSAGLHTMGLVQGCLAANYTQNVCYWSDAWSWKTADFGDIKLCPWIYLVQQWLMGIAYGATVFQLESAHQWGAEGQAAPNYNRYYLPFIQAVVKHKLIPSRKAFVDQIKVAVESDRDYKKHADKYEDPDFRFLVRLYNLKLEPKQEIIPNGHRYGVPCLLPPEAKCAYPHIKVVKQSDMKPGGPGEQIFAQAYPERFQGDAFIWECDSTVIVTNSNEKEGPAQSFKIPFPNNHPVVVSLSGSMNIHQYLIGKIKPKEFWFQTNAEKADAVMEIQIQCKSNPKVTCVLGELKSSQWNAPVLNLCMTYTNGPCEIILGL